MGYNNVDAAGARAVSNMLTGMDDDRKGKQI